MSATITSEHKPSPSGSTGAAHDPKKASLREAPARSGEAVGSVVGSKENFKSEGLSSESPGSEGVGAEGLGAEGLGAEGLGSEGLGSEGFGSERFGSEGLGSEGYGSKGLGSEGVGSEGLGSDGLGSEGLGSEGLGSEEFGSERFGSEGLGSEGFGSKGLGSKGLGSKGLGSKRLGAKELGSEGSSSEELQAALPPNSPAQQNGLCPHCDTPVSPTDRNAPFCCRGCAEVYRLLHEEGLDRFYDLAGNAVVPVAEKGEQRSMAWLEAILAPTQEQSGNVCSVELDIQGIHCAACVWLMNELYLRKPGASAITVNPAIGKVRLAWERDQVDIADFVREVERFGYRFGPSRKKIDPQSRSITLRIGVSVALSMNVMMFSTSFYTGLSPADGELYTLFGRLAMGLTTLVVLIGGWPFFKSSWEGIRRGMLHLDIPIAMGITLAYITSVVQTRGGQGELAYFDTLAIFVTLMLVGRWLQQRVLDRNRSHLLEDAGIDGLVVRRQSEDRLEVIPAAKVVEGDVLLLAPGDLVPMDCELLDPEVALSTDWINGESEPHLLHQGDTLPAGGFNAGQNAVRMQAQGTLLESPLPALLRAGTERSNMRHGRLLDGIAKWYVPAVLFIAITGFLLWLPVSTKSALDVTVALLVVTCPCALGLALPLGLEMALAHLRRSGVFVRSGDLLDRALKVRKVLFDKTGTLTLGKLELVDPGALHQLSASEKNTLYALSARSNHPVSRCIFEALSEAGEVHFSAEDVIREFPGLGVELEHDGRTFRLGRPSWALRGDLGVEENEGEEAGELSAQHSLTQNPSDRSPSTLSDSNLSDTNRANSHLAASKRSSGETLKLSNSEPPKQRTTSDISGSIFSVDGQAITHFLTQESMREDARREITGLKQAGYEVWLISGDASSRVEAAADSLGIAKERCLAEQSPEDKAAAVSRLDEGDTLFVGDGVNDSLAFAKAHTTASPAVDRPVMPGKSDFFLLSSGIGGVSRLLVVTKAWRRTAKRILLIALTYNALVITASYLGLMTPLRAAIAMPISSVFVILFTVISLSHQRLSRLSAPNLDGASDFDNRSKNEGGNAAVSEEEGASRGFTSDNPLLEVPS